MKYLKSVKTAGVLLLVNVMFVVGGLGMNVVASPNTTPISVSLDYVQIISFLGTAMGGLLWWGLLRMVKAQDNLGAQLHEMALAVTKICGNLEKATQWQVLHETNDNEREIRSIATVAEIKDLVEKLRSNAPNHLSI